MAGRGGATFSHLPSHPPPPGRAWPGAARQPVLRIQHTPNSIDIAGQFWGGRRCTRVCTRAGNVVMRLYFHSGMALSRAWRCVATTQLGAALPRFTAARLHTANDLVSFVSMGFWMAIRIGGLAYGPMF